MTSNPQTLKEQRDIVINSLDAQLKTPQNAGDVKSEVDTTSKNFAKKLDRVADTIYEKAEVLSRD